jgi:hypothetical protein
MKPKSAGALTAVATAVAHRKKILGAWFAGGLLLAGVSIGAPSAQASSAYGCIWPQACIYNGGGVNSTIIGRYKDVTYYWQYLSHPETGYAVYNTRNDDTVYVLEADSDGAYRHTYCIGPNDSLGSIRTIFAIRIDSSSTC